jgi:hypothetical protein
MIADVKTLLNARPFVPFTIVTTGGSRYTIPASDHCGIDPKGSRLVIWFDDSSGVTLAGLHIASLEHETLVP